MNIPRYISRLALVLAGFLIALIYDKEILDLIIRLRVPLLNNFFIWISYAGSFIIVLFIMTSLFILETRERKNIPLLWLTLGSASIVTWLLKKLFENPRPLVEALIAFDTYSFPSGHATAVFSALPLLSKEFPKYRWFWIPFALLVAFSRMYLGVHYLSDIIAGAFIGYTIGILFLFVEERTKFFENLFFRVNKKLQ